MGEGRGQKGQIRAKQKTGYQLITKKNPDK